MVTPLVLGLILRLVQPAHPMHTSVTEIQDSAGITSIRIRVFEDDFTTALGHSVAEPGADSAMSRYVQARFVITDRVGQPAALSWEPTEHTGGVLLFRLRATLPGGLAGATVKSAILCERFADQVNIVRASYHGRTTTLLFTPGDGARVLP